MMIWWWVFKTECLTRCRQSHTWLYPLGFFVMVIYLFPLAFSPDPAFLKKYVAGCLWIAALLASLLSIEPLFQADLEDGHLEQLLLSPTSLTWLLSAKLLAHWLITQIPLILLTPILGILFHLSMAEIAVLMLTLLLGTPLLTLIGSLGVSLTLGLKQPGMLLSLLILPLVTPVIIFAISAVQQAQSHLNYTPAILLLSGLCVLALTFIPVSLATTLRISLE